MTKKNKPVGEMIHAEENTGTKVMEPTLPEEQEQESSQTDATIEGIFSQEAKRVFSSHSAAEVHITADIQSFFDIQNARIHSESLKDKKIVTIKREEV